MYRLIATLSILLTVTGYAFAIDPGFMASDPEGPVDVLRFNGDIDVDTPCEPYMIKANSDDGTLDVCTNIAGHAIQIGQEMAPRVVNKSGDTILNGQVVNITGAQGNRIAAGLANASDPSARIIGVATSDILDNQEGPVALIGLARGIDTTGFSAGDFLYLSATESGAITNSIPDAPNRKVFIGLAVNSTVNGAIWVTISNGRPIGGNHDVALAASLGPPDDSTLLYNATSSTWEPVPHTFAQLGKTFDGTTLDFATDAAFVNITGLDESLESNTIINGTDGSITILDTDDYECSFVMSHTSATPAKYVHAIGINGVPAPYCMTARTINTASAAGGVPIDCQRLLNANDVVTGMVNSITGPETIEYEAINLNCHRNP
jgi:hypothetical protein